MKQHQLTIHAQFRPELLERVLRVVRHRGFQLRTINMEAQAECQDLCITITVESERPIQLLHTQLAKLNDVTHVAAQLLTQQTAFPIRA